MARHFFTTEELQSLSRRFQLLKRTVEILDQRLDQEQKIANAALHDLAVERGADVGKFILTFRREQLAGERRIFNFNENEEAGQN